MGCYDTQMDLQAYVDGDLAPEQVALLEEHLTGCDDCRAELARLRTVMEALETWPLVVEPAQLTARVMAQVKPRPAPPCFRLRWGDLAISLAGAGLAFAAILFLHRLSRAYQGTLYGSMLALRLEVLRLEGMLAIRRLAMEGAVVWWPLFVGVALGIVLAVFAWDLTRRRWRVLSV